MYYLFSKYLSDSYYLMCESENQEDIIKKMFENVGCSIDDLKFIEGKEVKLKIESEKDENRARM